MKLRQLAKENAILIAQHLVWSSLNYTTDTKWTPEQKLSNFEN